MNLSPAESIYRFEIVGRSAPTQTATSPAISVSISFRALVLPTPLALVTRKNTLTEASPRRWLAAIKKSADD